MLLIYQNPSAWQLLTDAERESLMGEAGAIMDELVSSGEWVGGEALADPSNSKSVRVREGVPAITDGPYAEAKEQMVGYCLVDCESMQRAVEIASRWPDAKLWGIEVRPLMGSDGTDMGAEM
jgi:hypothetical protein